MPTPYSCFDDKHKWVNIFKEGGSMMVFLCDWSYLAGIHNKPRLRNCGPSMVLRKINDNVCFVAFPESIDISNMFMLGFEA